MVEKISDETLDAIKRKSACSLPDRPSEQGIKAEDIKKAFYLPIVDKSFSLASEVNRIVDEINSDIENIELMPGPQGEQGVPGADGTKWHILDVTYDTMNFGYVSAEDVPGAKEGDFVLSPSTGSVGVLYAFSDETGLFATYRKSSIMGPQGETGSNGTKWHVYEASYDSTNFGYVNLDYASGANVGDFIFSPSTGEIGVLTSYSESIGLFGAMRKCSVIGPKGADGEPGSNYILTDEDKKEITDMLLSKIVDVSEVGQ